MKFKSVLLRPVERGETTAPGIVLPDTAKEKSWNAEVVAADAHHPRRGRGLICFERS